jgi:RecA-family ATPase
MEDRFDQDQAAIFLHRLFGDRKGYISLVFGHNPRMQKPRFAPDDFRPAFYLWPEQSDDLFEAVDDSLNHPDMRGDNVEVFICPSLRKIPSRSRGTHAPLMWVWADLDVDPTQDQIDRMNRLGAMTVLSGSEGHRHVYIPLDRAVKAVDHKALCLSLKDAIKAKDSKIAENDLLRLPGTLNWKSLEPKQVFLKSIGRKPKDPKELIRLLNMMHGNPWSHYKEYAEATTPKQLEDVRDVPRPKLTGDSLKAYRYSPDSDGQRHDAIYKLVKTMKEQGYTRDQTHATLHTYPPALSKFKTPWAISNDVDRIWQKSKLSSPLSADKKTAAPAAADISEEDDGSEQPELEFHVWGDVVKRVDEAPPPQYLFQGIWVEGDYGVVSAPDKSGKSWTMADAAISCASGTPWMNRWETPLGPSPVVICFGEGSERKQIRRARAIARHKGISDEDFRALPIHPMFSVPQISDDQHLTELEAKIRTVRPALVIIDPFYLAASGADSSNLIQMGTMLRRIQLVCQRHGAALMISHHFNKSSSAGGNGDVHSRSSGVGPTAWGRVLVAIEIERNYTDPITKRSQVTLKWDVKGDEIANEQFHVQRDVWETTPGDLSSDMNYSLQFQDQEAVAQAKPLVNAPSMQRVSQILEDHKAGYGIRAIMRVAKESGKAISQKTVENCLDQLMLHGFVQEGPKVGLTKPYLSVNPFRADMLNGDMTLQVASHNGVRKPYRPPSSATSTTPTRRVNNLKPRITNRAPRTSATPAATLILDFSQVSRPRRRY